MQIHSNKHNHSVEVRVSVADGEEIPSLSAIWKTADWHEREAYDMMGINFSGHPCLHLRVGYENLCSRTGAKRKKNTPKKNQLHDTPENP